MDPLGLSPMLSEAALDDGIRAHLENIRIRAGLEPEISINEIMKHNALGRFVNNSSQIGCVEGTGKDISGYRTFSDFKTKYGAMVEEKAQLLGVDAAALASVLFVESTGSGFYSDGRLKIRLEVHWLSKNLENSAYKDNFRIKDGEHQYRVKTTDVWKKLHVSSTSGDTQYEALQVAINIYNGLDKPTDVYANSPYTAISMGLGQQMGFNSSKCGFNSAKEMFEAYNNAEKAQIEGMYSFIKNYYPTKMLPALKEKKYETFVQYYNG